MIKLPDKVVTNNVIKPISGMACSVKKVVNAIAMGNGVINQKTKELPGVLQYANLIMTYTATCFSHYLWMGIDKSVWCARGNNGESTCEGDSGRSKRVMCNFCLDCSM